MLARCAPLLATGALLVAVVAPAHASFPGSNGKIAFTEYGSGISVMNPDGSGRVQVHADPYAYVGPTWSPDGTRIAFASRRDDPDRDDCWPCDYEIYVMDADGSDLYRLTYNDGLDLAPSWAPDGSRLTFQRGRTPDSSFVGGDIWTIGADGADPVQVTNSRTAGSVWEGHSNPAWSPDGAEIAFSGAYYDVGGHLNQGVWAIRPDGTGLRFMAGAESSGGDAPDWAPNASELVNALSPHDFPSSELITFRRAGGTTYLGRPALAPVWSPDGKRLLVDAQPEGLVTMKPDGTDARTIPNSSSIGWPDWQPIPYTGYARPKAAFPVEASLVPAYRQCFKPNREHGPPLGFPSCNPPVQTSGWLTVGTADSNGLPIRSIGNVKYQVVTGDPSTAADEADVRITFGMTDVRNRADLTDYTGEVQIGPGAPGLVRITDRFNAVAPGGGSDPATVVDIPLPPTATCAATADPGVGGTCSLASTLDAFVPGMVTEGKRAIWEFGPIEVWDGGEDGVVATTPNDLFARQGVLVP